MRSTPSWRTLSRRRVRRCLRSFSVKLLGASLRSFTNCRPAALFLKVHFITLSSDKRSVCRCLCCFSVKWSGASLRLPAFTCNLLYCYYTRRLLGARTDVYSYTSSITLLCNNSEASPTAHAQVRYHRL